MSFTLNLRRNIPGKELGKIVEASMQDACVGGWRFEKKKRRNEKPLYISYRGDRVIGRFTHWGVADMLMYPKEELFGGAAYLMRRRVVDDGFRANVGAGVVGGVLFGASIFAAMLVPRIIREDIILPNFALDDSIFTIIKPNKEYSELAFFVNESVNRDSKSCGFIQDEKDLSVEEIALTYKQLTDNLNQRLGTRTRSFYRD